MYGLKVLRSVTIVDKSGVEAPVTLSQVSEPDGGYSVSLKQSLSSYSFRPELADEIGVQLRDLAGDALVYDEDEYEYEYECEYEYEDEDED